MLRLLPQNLINQISAGEVVERPASVVKELVENSLDAGATAIHIVIKEGGKSYISITDNGKGLSKEEMKLAVQRHATSKLPNDDLFDINTMGFRGEALPSIASVSRFRLTSKQSGTTDAWQFNINGGIHEDITPSNIKEGTKIEVRDLFYNVPARLKFLKANTTEQNHVIDIIRRLSQSFIKVSFSVSDENKSLFKVGVTPSQLLTDNTDSQLLFPEQALMISRLSQTIGKDFPKNSIPIHHQTDDVIIKGFISIPTYNRKDSRQQFFYVNNRPMKDKQLFGAIRRAYRGYIYHDTFPILAVFIELNNRNVDMNVHPAKTEVRFRYQQQVQNILVSSIRNALSHTNFEVSTTVTDQATSMLETAHHTHTHGNHTHGNHNHGNHTNTNHYHKPNNLNPQARLLVRNHFEPMEVNANEFHMVNPDTGEVLENRPLVSELSSRVINETSETTALSENITADLYPLGLAKAQLHQTYIISQTSDSIIITDQHSAHERLTYETLKDDMAKNQVKGQLLLVPDVIELLAEEVSIIMDQAKALEKLGLVIEKFSDSTILVRQTPALLGQVNSQGLISDLLSGLTEWGDCDILQEKLSEVIHRIACHGSVRAGKNLTQEEMNTLLRTMESTPKSAQCIHGRPTYIKLDLKHIEKLFGR